METSDQWRSRANESDSSEADFTSLSGRSPQMSRSPTFGLIES